MTREELRDYVDEQRSLNNIPYHVYSALIDGIDTLEQEPCEDAISRKSIKQKLQEHHDFFVNAYGGFSDLPQNDKSRVDEITNCIAMVVNEPSVTPQEPRKGCLSIDDVMSVFDDFMCGEVDEDGTATFLEMLIDKAGMRVSEV